MAEGIRSHHARIGPWPVEIIQQEFKRQASDLVLIIECEAEAVAPVAEV